MPHVLNKKINSILPVYSLDIRTHSWTQTGISLPHPHEKMARLRHYEPEERMAESRKQATLRVKPELHSRLLELGKANSL